MEAKVVDVPAMEVVRFHALSASPESDAWDELEKWARSRGLLEPGRQPEIYGFNNPNPSEGSPHYGYEFWIRIDDPAGTDAGPGERLSFPGGRYLSAPFEGEDPYKLPEAWKALVEWAEDHGYRMGTHQWLERITASGMPCAIFLPVD